MFEIPVGDLLASYSGDSKELEFKGDIPSGTFDEFEFKKPLELSLKIIGLDDGVSIIFVRMSTTVHYEGKDKEVHLENVEREFKATYDPNNPDDIKYINMRNASVDIKEVIREEILIQAID